MSDTYLSTFRGFGLVQTVPPSAEPLTMVEAKTAARVDTDADEDFLADLIAAAREYAENATGRQMLTATWRLTLDRFPGGDPWWGPWWHWGSAGVIRLPRPPLQSVSAINYTDSQGNTQAVDLVNDVIIDDQREPPRLTPAWGKVWPVIRSMPDAVKITYVSGYTSPGLIPRQIKLAMKMLVAHWYDNRSAIGGALEAADRLLWQQWIGEV